MADKPNYITLAHLRTAISALLNEIDTKPDEEDFANVAFSGDYSDLTNRPDLSAYVNWDTYSELAGYASSVASVNGILKCNGNGSITAATAGTDYQAPLPSSSGNSGLFLTTDNNGNLSWATNASDDKTWTGVTLNKNALNRGEIYVPGVEGVNNIYAYYNKATHTPTNYAIAKYDANAYLNSTTPGASDNSTKVATTAFVKSKVESLGTVLNYKGTKATAAALPSSDNTAGDVWIVTADNSEYVWNGTAWEEFGPTIDLSGYVPTSRKVNNKALSTDITLSASDVGALPDSTDVTKWNGVSLNKTSAIPGSTTVYIPFVVNTSPTSANLLQASSTPSQKQLPLYGTDGVTNTPYLFSSTPTSGDNSTKVATTAYVDSAINDAISNAATITMVDHSGPTTTQLNSLTINKLTQAQYNAISTPDPNQLYMITDDTVYATQSYVDNAISNIASISGNSTDNAIARFDGTNGSLQNSGVLIGDDNLITCPGRINFANGTRYYVTSTGDASFKNLGLGSFERDSGSDYILKLGGNTLVNGTIYLANGTTYGINNSANATLNNVAVRNSTGVTHSTTITVDTLLMRSDTRAGTSSIGTGTTTDTTIDQGTWGQMFFRVPALRKTYATAGDTSSSYTSSVFAPHYWWRVYSANSTTGARLGYYENYSLPGCTLDRTANASYNILTSKSAVTIAQGGTGATTAAAAWTALGGGDSGKHADSYFALASHNHGAGNITSGTLAVARGGTGATSVTQGGVIYGSSTTAYASTSAGTSGYLLQSGGTGAPSWINATNANTASTIVKRDGSGNFSAGTITATLSGNASTATTATNATNVNIVADTSSTIYVLGATTTGNTRIYRESSVYMSSNVLYGAAWNDYAEYRELKEDQEIPYGHIVIENGDDTLSLSTERLQPGGQVVSDTFGFAIGQTEKCKLPIAVSGRALVYTYEDRYEFSAGDAVCTGPNGTVSKMTREEIKEYPERIIGTVSAIPEYENWGEGNVKVDGRIWIYIK